MAHPLTLADLHALCVVDAPIPAALADPEPAWKWAARYATPVWRSVPYDDPAALRAALLADPLGAPLYMIVQGVDRGRFGRIGLDFAALVDAIARTAEPDVVLVDAEGRCLAIVTEEHAILVLRGTRADWP